MKPFKERLLGDVLADENYAEFRRTVYCQALTEMRRRRSERLWRQFQALAACAVIAIGLVFLVSSRTKQSRVSSGGCEVVRSLPLRADQVVASTGFGVDVISTTQRHSMPGHERLVFELVRTASAPGALDFISDATLLELFPGQPMALVSTDQGGKRLCFLDPAVRALFVDDDSANSL